MEDRDSTKGILAWEWFSARAHGKSALTWLLGISFFEPICLPLMPELLMVAMILAGREKWKKYAVITTIASTLGGIAGYLIGAFVFKEFGGVIISHYELHEWFQTAHHLLRQNVFLVALLLIISPVPDKLLVILSGFFHVPFIPFLIGFSLGRALRFGVSAYLVHRFGAHMLVFIRRYFEIVAILFVLLAAVFVLHSFPVFGL